MGFLNYLIEKRDKLPDDLKKFFTELDIVEELKNNRWLEDQVKDIEYKILELMKESFSRGKRINSLELALEEEVDEDKKDGINLELEKEKELSRLVYGEVEELEDTKKRIIIKKKRDEEILLMSYLIKPFRVILEEDNIKKEEEDNIKKEEEDNIKEIWKPAGEVLPNVIPGEK